MESYRILLGRLKAVPLLGHDVQQHRASILLGQLQVFPQLRNAMAVDRTNVVETQLLEEHSAVQTSFHRILDQRQESLHRIADQRQLAQHASTTSCFSPV